MSKCGCQADIDPKNQRNLLIIVLVINLVMFFLEFAFGLYAESTGLLADSLDMLADAMVYGSALYVIGKTAMAKANSSMLSGMLQMLLGFGIIFEVIRRFLYGSEPISTVMIVISLFALTANVVCLVLLNKHKQGEVHMRATWIFSKNDVIANLGVITAGILVAYFESALPDLIIGAIISSVVLYGSYQILSEAMSSRSSN
ncbi:MAG: cation transporter [Gammaproteobacteria bacterium]